MKNKKIVIAMLVVGVFSVNNVYAAAQMNVPLPVVPDYKSDAEIQAASKLEGISSTSCDLATWQSQKTAYNNWLNSPAVQARVKQYDPFMQATILDKINSYSCIEGMMSNINNIVKSIQSILAILGGGVPTGILDQILNQLKQMACSEINSMTGSVLGGTANSVGSAAGVITSVGSTGYSVPVGNSGSISTGSVWSSAPTGNSSSASPAGFVSKTWNAISCTFGSCK